MRDQNPALSGQFVEGQRKRLEALREQLRGAEAGRLAAARTSRLDYADEAGDAGDKSQDNIQDEVSQGLHDVDQPRLKAIERALQKITEGSYGLSDLSGEPIPKARLEATPEAVITLEEGQAKS
jgi:DnaK suppressor protein